MKKLKLTLNSILLSIAMLLTLGITFLLPSFNADSNISYAASEESSSYQWSYTEQRIPYSLITQRKSNGEMLYRNYDYSGEHIMLSTNSTDALYDTTIYVKFNHQLPVGSAENRIPEGTLSVTGYLNGRPIYVPINTLDDTNHYINFAISFRPSTVMSWNEGADVIDPQDRKGLYQFNFTYKYQVANGDNGNLSDEEYTVSISFNIIDKEDYLADRTAYSITGANSKDDVYDKGVPCEAYSFNYTSYDEDGNIVFPKVGYEANKFALNYTREIGSKSYEYKYARFDSNYLESIILDESFDATQATGSLAITNISAGSTKYYNTYKRVINTGSGDVVCPYYVEVDIPDLGYYCFYVDILIPTQILSSVTYEIAEVPGIEHSKVKYLTNFGYQITYKDQAANTYKPLRNEYTYADVLAFDEDAGQAICDIPDHMPVTDQAPIKFNYYASGFDNVNSRYKIFTTEAEARTALNTLKDKSYGELLADRTLDTTFSNTSKFDVAGYYLIKVCYSIQTKHTEYSGMQMFLFQIKTSAPALVVEYDPDDTGTSFELLTSKYTNKNVRFKILNDVYSFNAPIIVKYTRYERFNSVVTGGGTYVSSKIDGSDDYYAYTMDGSKYSIPKTLNGRYVITVTYSPSRLNQYYEYIIDTSAIKDITFNTVSYEEDGYYIAQPATIAQTTISQGVYDISLTDSAFTLSWQEKPWAAYTPDGITTTTVTAYYLPIKETNNEATFYKNYDNTLTNGWETDSAAPLNYANSYRSVKLETLPLTSQQYQTANGIYYFYVEDYAGNIFERLILIDNTKPTFMQLSLLDDGNGNTEWVNSYDPISNPANYVRTKTQVIFGKNKGLVYNYMDTVENKIFNEKLMGTSLFKGYPEDSPITYFLNIPITQIECEKTLDDGTYIYTTLTPQNTNSDYGIIVLETAGTGFFDGEGGYRISAFDANETESFLQVSMNFDGAAGQFYMKGDYTGDTTEKYVSTYSGTNRYILSFKFKSGSDKEDQIEPTEVTRITLAYYPFKYDSKLSSYPFSNTAEKEEDLQLPDYDQDKDFLYTIPDINLDNGKTAPGKYVLTRYYYGGGYELINGIPTASPVYGGEYNDDGSKYDFGQDKYSRSYTIYVDHNGIISTTMQNSMREVGEHISITIGKGTSNEYTFKNFFRNVSAGSPILTTNKLPIQINIPAYKYFVDDPTTNKTVMCILPYNRLDVVITYKDTTKLYAPTITYQITSASDEGYFDIPSFTGEGTYTITISDRSGYTGGTVKNQNPMTYSCTFIVRHSYPTGDVYLEDELLAPSETDDKVFATNAPKDKKVEFVWQDSPDPYTASVVEMNITAAGIEGKDTFLISDYNLENILNGTESFDYSAFKYIKKIIVEKLSSDTFEGKIYNQYKFYIQLNIDEEIDYNIEIRYAVSSDANHGYGQYVSTNYRVKIDRTRPMINIDNLLEQDTYLISSKYYNDIDNLKEYFKEEKAIYSQTKPTIYDYSFAVDAQTFKLMYDGEDTISKFYFRQYDKFNTENQSIAPDHTDYTNLKNFSNFPRFNITESNKDYYIANYVQGSTLASLIAKASATNVDSLANTFYEIIERDLAGNYRVFTVYFAPTARHSILDIEVKEDSGELNTTQAEITSRQNLVVESIKATNGWGKLVVKNITDSARTPIEKVLTPYLSNAEIYNLCNELTNYLTSNINCRIEFTLTTAAGVSTKYFNLVKNNSRLPIPDVIKNADGTFIMVFPKKTNSSVIYLTELLVQYLSTKEYVVQAIGSENIPAQKDNLQSGVYAIKYTDNTGETYTYQLHLGIDYVSAKDQFTYATGTGIDDGNGTIYTGGDIYITFQSKAHKISISNPTSDYNSITISAENYNQISPTNCIEINGDNYYRINNDIYIKAIDDVKNDNGFRVILLKGPSIESGVGSEVVGGTKKYMVTYYYSAGTDTSDINTYNFVIYNKLAAINLFDSNDNEIVGSTTSGSMALTSSSVKINWGNLDDVPLAQMYKPVVILNTLEENGSIIASVEIINNSIITKPGYYAVELCNTAFGNFRTVYFSIQDGEIPFFTVVDTTTGALVSKSPQTLDILNNLDTVHNRSLKEQILNHIEVNYNTDSEIKALLINKLNASPTNIEQYFSLNNCDLRLDASSDLHYISIYFRDGTYMADTTTITKEKYFTTFYLIYGDNNPIYANLIAVTRVPKSSTNIVGNKLYYIYQTSSEVVKELTGISSTIKNDELQNQSVHIYWNSVSNDNNAWYNRGNLVYMNYTFNNVTSTKNFGAVGYSSTVSSNCGLSTITISGSGKHILTFVDLAGNISFFRPASTTGQAYYTVTILDKVIFTVNNSTPLDYAVYNGAITLAVDTSFSSDYNINSLAITVMRNGSYYENYIITDNTKFTFSESGRYIVTLDATYQNTMPLNSAYYNFTIIDKTSARLAYEFNEMLGYEVTKVYKDNKDITNTVKQYYISQNRLNVTPEEYSLKEFFVSPEKFGNGDYIISIAVKYNALLAAKEFTFGFKISDVVPVIMTTPAYGETTKGKITLTFNAAHIYQQIGKSSIKVYTFNADTNRFNLTSEYVIDESRLANPGVSTFEIKETNSYYFQLVTDSGNIVTSFRINRAEPLNALSIIIIVAAVATFVVLTIIFVKMRTKMRVK